MPRGSISNKKGIDKIGEEGRRGGERGGEGGSVCTLT
jgi:hypothetical protein